MAFSKTLTCSIVASNLEVLKKMQTGLCWLRNVRLEKVKIKAIIFSIVRYLKKEADEIIPNSLVQKEADGIVE